MLSLLASTFPPKGFVPTGNVRVIRDKLMAEAPAHIRLASPQRIEGAEKRYLEALTGPMTADELGKAAGVRKQAAYAWLSDREGQLVRRIGDKRPFKWERIA